MIRRIELHNFMSHRHTVIEPAEGLTVLTGPNNCGKSAVVAALSVLCHNDIAGNMMVSHGEKASRVIVETDDGHTVEWQRKRSGAVSYTIDGNRIDRIGRGGTPDGLHDMLRLPMVQLDERESIDVHIAAQKSPIFLLNLTSAGNRAARFFAASSDASRLLAMQTLHRSKVSQAKRDEKQLADRIGNLDREAQSLAQVDEIDRTLAEAEAAYATIAKASERIRQLAQLVKQLEQQQRTTHHLAARSASLAALEAPPALQPAERLEQLCTRMATSSRKLAHVADRAGQLQSLTAPPAMADVPGLSRLIDRMQTAEHARSRAAAQSGALESLAPAPAEQDTASVVAMLSALRHAAAAAHRAAARHAVLEGLSAPPAPTDAQPLSQTIDALRHAAEQVAARESALREIQERQDRVRDDVAAYAAEHPTCPTCGAALDADRLLEQGGAHRHA